MLGHTIERGRLRPDVHSKIKPHVRAQVTGRRDVSERFGYVHNVQGVSRGQQLNGGAGLVLARVPDDGSGLFNAHVRAEGVGCTVQAAGGQNVDGGWGH